MKLAIVGTTEFKNYEYFCQKLRENFNIEDDVEEIVSGGAKGADSLAEQFAKENNIPLKVFPAEWSIYGKAAGPIRNRLVAERADTLIAFWDWKSRGTKHVVETARKLGKNVVIENVEEFV